MRVPAEVSAYLKDDDLPVFWCSGCGNGIILSSIMRTFHSMKLPANEIVVVTGIGCWGKADDYLRTNSLHGTHGRALAFATGVKAANPDLTVMALMGDGDCATIGGNHFLHAARRNIDITAVVSNNFNYGMTGGQYSATTPAKSYTSTSVYGNPEGEFDLCEVGVAARAGYVARSTVYHVTLLQDLLKKAISHRGFSLLEVHSSCPVYFGRYNQMNSPVEMMKWWESRAVPQRRYEQMSTEEQAERVPIGVLHEQPRPDFSSRYAEVQQIAQKRAGDSE